MRRYGGGKEETHLHEQLGEESQAPRHLYAQAGIETYRADIEEVSILTRDMTCTVRSHMVARNLCLVAAV